MENLAGKIPVEKLVEIFESISKSTGKKKMDILTNFFEECRNLGKILKQKNPAADISMFPIVRLFLLKNDRERGPHGLKEKTMGMLFVRVFCLGTTSVDARKLLKYKQPTKGASFMDDFAERVFWVLKPRLLQSCSMTIEDLNRALDNIAEKNASNKTKDAEFLKIIDKCGPLEIKWITRLILKDIKLGLGASKILKAYHPDAERLFSENSNVRTVCDTLLNRTHKIEKNISNITLLQPFKPMLLERLEIKKIARFFNAGQGELIVQTKFDGERSQLHMKNGKFKYFSRHGLDITDKPGYGESSNSGGFLTSKIVKLLNPNCHSIILDGELMGWHKQKQALGKKAEPYDVKKLTSKSYYQPCFVAFDIVLYNDELLINKSFKERLKILQQAFQDSEGILIKCKNTKVLNADELLKLFNECVDNKDEGIVLRECNATYKPNVREKSGCYKIKSEYSDDLIHDIDLAIVGGYYGEGKHAGKFSSFLVAVVVPSISENMQDKFYSVVSVSTGLGDAKLNELKERFKPYWTNEKPEIIEGPKKEVPDVWIHPQKSLVLQIRATELIRCKNQPTRYTFRWPRVINVREDKSCYDACTLQELKSLIYNPEFVQKLTKRHANKNDIFSDYDSLPKKKIRESTSTLRVNDQFYGVRSSDIISITKLFAGKEFCIMNGEENLPKIEKLCKADLEKIVLKHSGTIVQNPSEKTFLVIVGNPRSERAKNLIKSKKYNVAKIKWLLKATKEENWKSIKEFEPWELLSYKPLIKEVLKKNYDMYYDSYTKSIDKEILKKCLDRIKQLGDVPTASQENQEDLELELFGTISPFSIFSNIIGYFTDTLDPKKHMFLFLKGNIRDEIDQSVTHIFVNHDKLNLFDLYNTIDELDKSLIKIINNQWITDCVNEKTLLPETSYLMSQKYSYL